MSINEYRWGGVLIAAIGIALIVAPFFLTDDRLDADLYTAGALIAVGGIVRFAASFRPAWAAGLRGMFVPFLVLIVALMVAVRFGLFDALMARR